MTERALAPFVSDALSVAAFFFLVLRGHRLTSKTITDNIKRMTDKELTKPQLEAIGGFMTEFLEVSDMHRRTNLAALVSVTGVLSLQNSPRIGGYVSASLLMAWIILYFVSQQLMPQSGEISRPDLRKCRGRLIGLFAVWMLVSVGIKSLAAFLLQ
jgi:hypothetical protein